MIIPMLCVTIFVILVVWFLLPSVARLMIHTPASISIFLCLTMLLLLAVLFNISCSLSCSLLQHPLAQILVLRSADAFSVIAFKIRVLFVEVCPSQYATRR